MVSPRFTTTVRSTKSVPPVFSLAVLPTVVMFSTKEENTSCSEPSLA